MNLASTLFVGTMLLSAVILLSVIVSLVVWDATTPREQGRVSIPPAFVGYAIGVIVLLQMIGVTAGILNGVI